MKRALVAGTFDPITVGHTDIIKRAAELFDEVTVAVLDNAEKRTVFTMDERLCTVARAIEHLGHENVGVTAFDGLTSELMRKLGIRYIVRGLRNATDFDYEFGMAQIMREFAPESETVFLPSLPEHMHVSSTYVRERIKYGAPLEGYVAPGTAELISDIYKNKR